MEYSNNGKERLAQINMLYFKVADFRAVPMPDADYGLLEKEFLETQWFVHRWCDEWNFKKGHLIVLRKNYGYDGRIEQDWVGHKVEEVLNEVPNP